MSTQVRTNFIPRPGMISFVVEDVYVKGGFRVVATTTARDAIPLESRKAGMLVYVAAVDKYYKLKADSTTWEDFSSWQDHNYTPDLPGALQWKTAVRVATTAPYTLATGFANGQVCDGVTLVTGDRVLIKDQVSGSENGPYTVNATGAPTRATDADIGSELSNMAVHVAEGTANANKDFYCTNIGTITAGTTALVFAEYTPEAHNAGTADGILLVRESGLSDISQNLFQTNALSVFDLEQCTIAPTYTGPGTPTDFMGLNFSSDGGAKLAQLGFGTRNGTSNLYIRTRPNAGAAWTAWSVINTIPFSSRNNSTDGTIQITKTAHGWVVGNAIAIDGTGAFVKGKADNPVTSEVIGLVSAVVDANRVILTITPGFLSDILTGLTPGGVYYLSAATAGTLTATPPSVPGQVNKPVFIATSATSGFFIQMRGMVVPDLDINSTLINLDTTGIVSNLITVENNSGSIHPYVQVMDNASKIRHDVVVTVDASWLTFDFTAVTTPTGVWHAVVVA